MTDIASDFVRGDLFTWAHLEMLLRALKGYAVKDGYVITAQGTPDNTVAVAAGNSIYAGADVARASPGNVTIATCSETQYRIDIFYAKNDGSIGVHQGDDAAKSDPLGNDNWRQYIEPVIKASIPTGAILGCCIVKPRAGGVPVIETADIWSWGPISSAVADIDLALATIASQTQGDMLKFGASALERLALGTAGLPIVAGATDPGYAALDKRGMRGAALGEIPTTRALDKDLAGRLHLVYPTDEAIELQAGMECIGDADGNSKPLYFRASSDDDSTIRSATNKTWRVEIEYLDGAGGGSGSITGATAASPCVITSNGHGLENGQYVFISGIVGIYGVNGKLWKVANKADNTFQLEGSTSTGTYSSGGTWYKGCIVAEMTNATPAAVTAPLVVLRNSGIWKTARTTADLTARCNADYSGQGNADLKISGDVSGLDLYVRAVRLYHPTTKAQITWTAGGVLQSPISPVLMNQDASGGIAYTSHLYSSDKNFTNTSYAELDPTNMALEFESRGGIVLLGFGFQVSGGVGSYFDLLVDGNLVCGSEACEILKYDSADEIWMSAVIPIALSPGPHRVAIAGKVASGTGVIEANKLTYLWARECF